MRKLAVSFIFVILVTSSALAAIKFPKLSGRVVDNANLLSPETEEALTYQLEAHESATTNQIVVVTLPALQGYEIEEFGYQLGRHWGIGQKGKNNGVVLLIAPNERKVRIEVGYGLEGTLTDATSSQIIHDIILPQFKTGNMEGGIVAGVDSVITVLGGGSLPAPRAEELDWENFIAFAINFIWIGLFVIVMIHDLIVRRSRLRKTNYGMRYIAWANAHSRSSSSSSWSSSGSSSFSGGGGSFGGGGSSGSW